MQIVSGFKDTANQFGAGEGRPTQVLSAMTVEDVLAPGQEADTSTLSLKMP